MLDKAKDYLQKALMSSERYLLGLSGGPDSMALFHLLIEEGIPFEVIHVDHNCRASSSEEASKLEKMVEGLGIRFHLVKLEKMSVDQPNLEDFLRTLRYKAFREVYQKVASKGLILGHHADDQVETVLKRVLEGSSLPKIKGMVPRGKIHDMLVIRPLMECSKEEIFAYLKERGIEFFIDKTNEDTRFLRARMRKEILPYLEKGFGKGVLSNLRLLGERCGELDAYLLRRVNTYFDRVVSGPFGHLLERPFPEEKLELEYLILELAKRSKILLSREEVSRICTYVKEKKFGKKVVKPEGVIYFDRNGLFFIQVKDLQPISEYIRGGWRAYWRMSLDSRQNTQSQICLRYPRDGDRLPNGISLKKWYASKYVPAFMRNWPSVICSGEGVVGECLTGFDWGF